MKTVGLQLRAQTCGPDAHHVRSEMGFDYVDLFLQIQSALQPYINKHLAGQPGAVTPVDPAGPHCYRDGTKTC